MRNYTQLKDTLLRIDSKGYPLYKQIKGIWQGPGFILEIDHVQGDPFAAATKLRIHIDHNEVNTPIYAKQTEDRTIAYRDFLARRFYAGSKEISRSRGTGKSGMIAIEQPSQAILERSSVLMSEKEIELRFIVGLPANGRRINGKDAAEMLCDDLPNLIREALYHDRIDVDELKIHLETFEDANAIRRQLRDKELVGFIANGSSLPRLSGIDDRPLNNATPFQSPKSFEVELNGPNCGQIKGLGVRSGVTLIVGGGYHGKSTVLKALEYGVYNHIPGDGREKVVTLHSTAKIRAEDGRQVTQVNISPFINNLPHNRSTKAFSTENASGSTSQATNIIEAMEAGAECLLLDEDTSATNFMIRDRRMQELIVKEKEPITPFVDRVRQMWKEHQISTVLVMGGSGDYFDTADHVIALEQYIPLDQTKAAHNIAKKFQTGRRIECSDPLPLHFHRRLDLGCFNSQKGKRDFNMKVRGTDELTYGEDIVDVFYVEQLVEPGQLRAIGHAIKLLENLSEKSLTIRQIVKSLAEKQSQGGIESICKLPDGDITSFRPIELAATINRYRRLKIYADNNEIYGK